MSCTSIVLLTLIAVVLTERVSFRFTRREECNENFQDSFECGDGICISKHVRCDLYDDCDDGSDENNCTNNVCHSNEFRCNSGQCVPERERCNAEVDCADKSDEENCLQCNLSDSDAFKCKSNSKCIPRDKLCNSIKDCPDGSDEDKTTCQNLKCTSDEFQCRTGHCNQKLYRCSGYDSCGDHSGETNCTECGINNMFKCEKDNKCIRKEKLCDMEPDCEDGSDESESTCQALTCRSGAFQCQNGQCVEEEHTTLCNGRNDCKDESDKSDEANCTQCSPQAFKCGSGECVHNYELCNTKIDCSDASDESEINCPDGTTPPVWTTFWDLSYISSNRNVTLQYLTDDLVVYFDSSVSPSVTWPFLPLSQAWKYAKETFGQGAFVNPGTASQFLYVVLGKRKVDFKFMCTFSFNDQRSGYRNLLDSGLRVRNGWATENSENFEKLFSNMAIIVKLAEEGTLNHADYTVCDDDINEIVFYDIYIHLKGEKSSEVLRWKANQFNKTLEVGKINCLVGWLLPIYETYGGATVLRNYFDILRVNMAKKKGVYSDSLYGLKQLNVGEFVHFWSGAVTVDLRDLAKSVFTMDDIFMKQFAKAQIDFPNIKYTGEKVTTGIVDAVIVIQTVLCIFILIVIALILKANLPHVISKYTVLVERYW